MNNNQVKKDSKRQNLINSLFYRLVGEPLDKNLPMVITIGGQSGAGKSQFALDLAYLGFLHRFQENGEAEFTKHFRAVNCINQEQTEKGFIKVLDNGLPVIILHEASYSINSQLQFDEKVRELIQNIVTIRSANPMLVLILAQYESLIPSSIKKVRNFRITCKREEPDTETSRFFLEFYTPREFEKWKTGRAELGVLPYIEVKDHNSNDYHRVQWAEWSPTSPAKYYKKFETLDRETKTKHIRKEEGLSTKSIRKEFFKVIKTGLNKADKIDMNYIKEQVKDYKSKQRIIREISEIALADEGILVELDRANRKVFRLAD